MIMAGAEPKYDYLDSGDNVRESVPNQMNPPLKCEGDGCYHSMGNDRPPCLPENCTFKNLGPEGNHAGLSDKEKFHQVEIKYDEEMQYIYGDLEPLEESKYLVLHDCEPKSWPGRLRAQPCDDGFETFEPTFALTEPQWKPNAGSPILENDLTLPNFDTKPNISMVLKLKLRAGVEFTLRPQPQCSMMVEQNVQAEAESASSILQESNPVRESTMTMQPEGNAAESEENYEPKNRHSGLRTPPCGDHIEALKPTSAQAQPQLKRKTGNLIIDSAVIRKGKRGKRRGSCE
ncbi:uncharacterized protein LOC120001732 isoform X3 [Tripterygium wilfordii]|uniref:uncharacterized protein LOC120001732 isoform X3 n=1 Tax=Tripterygium wilfordii TaxID=458696 RepID=UPI0018F84CFB|nr:uncharacterized protein LOC120001732 isoform X3 [Tripterygium wilfordii]